MSPFCPFCPFLPFVTKLINIFSLSEKGESSLLATISIDNLQKPVLALVSLISNNKNCVASYLLVILTKPFIAEVTDCTVSNIDFISTPLSSSKSMYNLVEFFCIAVSNLNLPRPGSDSVVVVSNV